MSSDSEEIVCLKEDFLIRPIMETLEQSEDGMSYHVIQVESKVDGQDECISPMLLSIEYDNGQKSPLANDSMNGNFYVINPSPQISTSVSCIPVAQSSKQKHTNAIRARDEKKKENHKEVERRRRDKINTWILKLGELIPPDVSDGDIQYKNVDNSVSRSKSLILAKACNYIGELKSVNESFSQSIKNVEQLVSKLEKKNVELECENNILKNMLVENGILIDDPVNNKTEVDSEPS